MQVPFIDLKTQYSQLKTEIQTALDNVLENALLLRSSPVAEFEAEFAKAIGVRHCIGVGNGTDALFIALKCLGVGEGDEVITAANTCFPTAEAILMTGAKATFSDVDPDFYTMDPVDLEKRITSNTKAIIPVHLYGQVAAMEHIERIANEHQIPIIEDASHAHFAELGGMKAGLFGKAAAFSFYPSKPLGAYGDAGCVLTQDDELALRIRKFANHGSVARDVHEFSGVNSRIDGMQAAVLRVKLRYAQNWLKDRNHHARLYMDLLNGIPEISLPVLRNDSKHAFHLFVIRLQDQEQRDGLIRHLTEHQIGTQIHYPYSLPQMSIFNCDDAESYRTSNEYSKCILSLPLFPEMSEEQVRYVSEKILDFFN